MNQRAQQWLRARLGRQLAAATALFLAALIGVFQPETPSQPVSQPACRADLLDDLIDVIDDIIDVLDEKDSDDPEGGG